MPGPGLHTQPHCRYNPLTQEWVLVSPQRAQRPWQGQVELHQRQVRPAYDPECYMCPGNLRASGQRNPAYTTTFVFPNDFPALLPDTLLDEDAQLCTPAQCLSEEMEPSGLLVAHSERGICRVVCFSPRHDLTLPRMELADIARVVEVWSEQTAELGAVPWISHVQVFENKGAMMGASNPHPHSQIWASQSLPVEPAKELVACREYTKKSGSCLLCDYLALELRQRERLVCENEHFVALVPFWAVWPFEALILSRRHLQSLPELCKEEQMALADILQRLTARYDNLFQTDFPYSMGFHQAPTDCPVDSEGYPELHFHAHYYPPLLRSATVRKFMVGFEMLATPQRDITAESSAARLREQNEKRFDL